MLDRGLSLPGHPAGIAKKRQIPRPPGHESEIIQTGHALGEERNSLGGTPQCRQTPSVPDETRHPIVSEPVLGGEGQKLVSALEQRSGL
jgi:hypothetical protein